MKKFGKISEQKSKRKMRICSNSLRVLVTGAGGFWLVGFAVFYFVLFSPLLALVIEPIGLYPVCPVLCTEQGLYPQPFSILHFEAILQSP